VLRLITCKMWEKIRNDAVSHLDGYTWTARFPGTYPNVGRQTLMEEREWKGDYPFYGDHTV